MSSSKALVLVWFQAHRGVTQRPAGLAGLSGDRQRGQGQYCLITYDGEDSDSHDTAVIFASDHKGEDHHHQSKLSEAGQKRASAARPAGRQRRHPVDHRAREVGCLSTVKLQASEPHRCRTAQIHRPQ